MIMEFDIYWYLVVTADGTWRLRYSYTKMSARAFRNGRKVNRCHLLTIEGEVE